jgi:DNA adenine methylase
MGRAKQVEQEELTMSLAPKAFPPLKYVGGKSRLLPEIRPFYPAEYGTYFEPFVGGGACYFYFEPAKAVISDTNAELINLYKVIRTQVEELIPALKKIPFSEEQFYKLRAKSPVDLTPVDRAARTVYLNKTCFNGMYRVNKSGEFNVPFGKYTNPTICDAENLRACALVLQNANTSINCCDFEQTVNAVNAGDFCYADPPYVPLTSTADFTSYSVDGFGPKEQERLRDALMAASHRGAYILASNSDTPYTRELYEGWNLKQVMVGRTISASANRTSVAELLISNY